MDLEVVYRIRLFQRTTMTLDLEKGFFVVFRFYGPLDGYIEKTWVLNDFERVK